MERVTLTYFVDFVLTVGTPRLNGVKEFKEHRYDHLIDFYKPLREAIVDMHARSTTSSRRSPTSASAASSPNSSRAIKSGSDPG
jgi:hypothetical protein